MMQHRLFHLLPFYFRAISTFYDARDWFNSLCKRVMEQDWSWNRPALDYMELYHSARKNWTSGGENRFGLPRSGAHLSLSGMPFPVPILLQNGKKRALACCACPLLLTAVSLPSALRWLEFATTRLTYVTRRVLIRVVVNSFANLYLC